jgi:hypothetical protein
MVAGIRELGTDEIANNDCMHFHGAVYTAFSYGLGAWAWIRDFTLSAGKLAISLMPGLNLHGRYTIAGWWTGAFAYSLARKLDIYT